MLFNSLEYLLFFPLVTLVYFILPLRHRYLWLLVTSLFFYMCWNVKYGFLLLFSIFLTYLCGLVLERIKGLGSRDAREAALRKRQMRWALVVCLVLNLGILFFFKYANFFWDNLNAALLWLGFRPWAGHLDVLLPVGISFYTFQALGYSIDVYRGNIYAEKNFFKYALFVSFFPQLVAGPIERSKNLLKQMNKPTVFNVENARRGLLTMAYGYVLKLVAADNIARVVDPVFSHYQEQSGLKLLLASVLFAFQIYCDFHGYTQIAIGSAKVLGFDIMENFRAPYFSLSVRAFWRNWHISLTSWFKDYVYIPLGGNRKGVGRTYLNLFIVFFLSGLWHGSAWHFVLWGALNGLYLIVGNILREPRQRLYARLHIPTERWWWRGLSCLLTFVFIDYAWIYFRAADLTAALGIQKRIVAGLLEPHWADLNIAALFPDHYELFFFGVGLAIAFVLLFLADGARTKEVDWQALILRQPLVYRWAFYVLSLFVILTFGFYGASNVDTQFIYFQF